MANGASAVELALHERLLAGDPIAPAETFERYLEPVTASLLRGRERGPDTHLAESAATDAIVKYVTQPRKYDPNRLPLLSYLRMAARRDYQNARKQEQRHTRRAFSIDDQPDGVELQLVDWNTSVEDEALEQIGVDLPAGLDRDEALRRIQEEFPDARDLALVQLLLDRERRTEPYAAVLGIQDRPMREQRDEVKRHKDRLNRRLQRLRARLGGTAAAAGAQPEA
jgi:RNA polymerase sigma-70 factor (ECF subfamily)